MKSFIQSKWQDIKRAFAEKPVAATLGALAAAAALVFILSIAIAILSNVGEITVGLLGLVLVAVPAILLIYKIFTGFPAIFSATVQIVSIVLVLVCLWSLSKQHQAEAGGRPFTIMEKMEAAASLEKDTGIPAFISMLILTETGALIGIAAGVAFGLIAEASAGIVTGSFNLSRINSTLEKLKTTKDTAA